MNENPALVQEARNRRASSIPVVLIHDGGGQIFGYYILDELRPARELWAIYNPDYDRKEPYPLTMEEMARNYIQLIESSGIRGPIYLGGEHRAPALFHPNFAFSVILYWYILIPYRMVSWWSSLLRHCKRDF